MKNTRDTALKRTAARKWLSVRLTEGEKTYVVRQAAMAGLSASAFPITGSRKRRLNMPEE